MKVFGIAEERHRDSAASSFLVGAAAGLALGMLLSRTRRSRSDEDRFAARAGAAVRRLRPGRLYRLAAEQEELDGLEDAVLNCFLNDEVLRDRAIDIGAISPGIIELSGIVTSDEESHRAVALANGVEEVRTVVNRLDVGSNQGSSGIRRRFDFDDAAGTFTRHEARVGGMGRRRQDPATDPDRRDDSQKLRERALAAADRDQLRDEGFGDVTRPLSASSGVAAPNPTRFPEDELDNQDPHDKHAERTLDAQPQELNTSARVGTGGKTGTRRTREDAEVPFQQPPPRDLDG
jgi:hypothetical protein